MHKWNNLVLPIDKTNKLIYNYINIRQNVVYIKLSVLYIQQIHIQ